MPLHFSWCFYTCNFSFYLSCWNWLVGHNLVINQKIYQLSNVLAYNFSVEDLSEIFIENDDVCDNDLKPIFNEQKSYERAVTQICPKKWFEKMAQNFKGKILVS